MNKTPESPPPQQRPWFLWLGAGVFGTAAIAAVLLLGLTLPQLSTPEAAPEAAPETAAPSPAEEADAQAAAFRTQQQHVSEVLRSLNRDIIIGNSPTQGNPDAEVVLLEFSDFQCPYCGQAAVEVDKFVEGHEAEVLFVYKHLPLARIHPEAIPAAKAAWAAHQQGKFWDYHDALFANQAELGEALYKQLAADLGLDRAQFDRDRASIGADAAIARDLALAAELQLNSTPTFLMNDLFLPGALPSDLFTEALKRVQAYGRSTPR